MAVHQRWHASADRRSAVSTYASEAGNVDRVLLTAFACEPVLLLATLALAWPRSLAAAVALGLWVALELTFIRAHLGPLRARLYDYEGAPLAGYYFVVLPLALALSRPPSEPGYAVVVAALLALSSPYLLRMARGSSHRRSRRLERRQARSP
jgi:hypothetical protein